MSEIKIKNILIVLLIVILTIMVGFSLSYAFFSAKISNTESNSTIVMEGGKLSVTYADGSGDLIVSNIYPRDKEWITKNFTVTGNTTVDLNAYYKLKMVIDNNEFATDALHFTLDSENTDNNGSAISPVTKQYINKENIEIGEGYFANTNGVDKTHKYTLKIYFLDNNDDQNEMQGAKFAGHIVIEAGEEIEEDGTTPKGWNNAKSGTLLAGIKANYPTIETPKTTPGSAISLSTEALLASTPDDYGTSYYFRGAITNNYVQFANKCWRVVRITGNGAIKLVLHNDNISKVSNPCNASNNDENAAFARYSDTTYTSAFNSSYNQNAYVGFMYGTPGSSTYAAEHANTHDSIILTNLKKWYDLSFNTEQKNMLADVIWCNDKSTYKNTSYNPLSITVGTNYGVANNTNYYSAISRINSSSGGMGSAASGILPTLICPNDNLGDKLSKYTAEDTVNGNGVLNNYKIGLLSSDEIIFAGGGIKKSNASYYLYENASSNYWWTMSPAYFYSSGGAIVMFNSSDFGINHGFFASAALAVRPAVSLLSSIAISGGTGTSSNPFVINKN